MKLLTIADMVDKLAEKVDECPLLGVIEYSYVHLGPRKLSIMRSRRCPLSQGLLKYCSDWKDSWEFQNCPLYHGCPLFRGVH